MVKLVGILNITPDSFSDGGLFEQPERAIKRVQQLFEDGASIVDIGAESTRPGATPLTHRQEWERLAPILPALLSQYPGKISLDTYHPRTFLRASDHGPVILNDVTGMNNPEMLEAVINHRPTVIISHLPGADPQKAHINTAINSTDIVKNDLLARAHTLEKRGVDPSHIILDPGIGFGKTMKLNTQLLGFAEIVSTYPIMIGYSRKRFLGDNRLELEPNLEAGKVAIKSGAAYLRVHDVAGHSTLLDASHS